MGAVLDSALLLRFPARQPRRARIWSSCIATAAARWSCGGGGASWHPSRRARGVHPPRPAQRPDRSGRGGGAGRSAGGADRATATRGGDGRRRGAGEPGSARLDGPAGDAVGDDRGDARFRRKDDVPFDAAAVARIRTRCTHSPSPCWRWSSGPRSIGFTTAFAWCWPPPIGKSTLLNLLVEREAAIVSPIAGTTRDRIEASVLRGGVAYVLTDTAGLAEDTDDVIGGDRRDPCAGGDPAGGHPVVDGRRAPRVPMRSGSRAPICRGETAARGTAAGGKARRSGQRSAAVWDAVAGAAASISARGCASASSGIRISAAVRLR